MDALASLRLQLEWGADEALDEAPVVRTRPAEQDARSAVATRRVSPAPAMAGEIPMAGRMRAGAFGGTPAAAPDAAVAAAADLDALRQAIRGFEGCALRDTATSTVLPEGNVAEGILLLGEVPDADEDRTGQPFAGRPGELLDRMLGSIGLDRGRVLLAPLIPWRPPGGRPPSAREMTICHPFLHRLLALARPRFLLLMGGRPARTVLNGLPRPGAGWQAPPADSGLPVGSRALAMRHPAMLLSHPPARKEAWLDLLRLRITLDAITGT